MNDNGSIDCRLFDRYADGELEKNLAEEFAKHIQDCPACRVAMDQLMMLRAGIRDVTRIDMPQDMDLRIRRTLARTHVQSSATEDVLDIEDVAEMLKIPISQMIELLDRIPSFEVCGRLRFQRQRIIEWIDREESRMKWEKEASVMRRPERKIIPFPEKAVGE